MIVTLQRERSRTLEQVAAFVQANAPVDFQPADQVRAYDFVARTLSRLGYRTLDKPSKALVKRFLAKTTGHSLCSADAPDPPVPRDGQGGVPDQRRRRGHAVRVHRCSRGGLRALPRLIEALLDLFPFVVVGFQADNASRRDAPAPRTSTTTWRRCSTSCTSGTSASPERGVPRTTPTSRARTPTSCAASTACLARDREELLAFLLSRVTQPLARLLR